MTPPPRSALSTPGAARTLRLLFWNTFLLRVGALRTPFGTPALHAKPAVAARADEIGVTLAGEGHDVVALCEVFDDDERARVLAGWTGRPGPSAAVGPAIPGRGLRLIGKSSGLFTLSHLPVVRTDRHRFVEVGDPWRDADAHAAKGVLLVEVAPALGDPPADGGNVEIYSTHLAYGGDFLPRGADGPRAVTELRLAQVAELIDFVGATHRRGNLALVCGDFNIPARDPAHPDEPTMPYQRMAELFDAAGFDDLWASQGGGYGYTCDLYKRGRTICPFDPADPDGCLETAELADAFGSDAVGERIDYWFASRPTDDVPLEVATAQVHRRAFPRVPGTPGYDELPFLSDHVALELTLDLSPGASSPGSTGG